MKGFLKQVFRFPSDGLVRNALWLSLVLHVVAALCSRGYHHYDEQYQILEFAAAKWGLTPVDQLPWEWSRGARAWFQPAFAYVIGTGMRGLGLWDPFWLALFLRLVSAVFGWWVTVGLVRCCDLWFSDSRLRRLAACSTALAWFLPYLHARFSSENWSGNLFFLGLLPLIHLVTEKKQGRWSEMLDPGLGAFVGLCWALAFQCRYQTVMLVVAAVPWVWIYGRPSLRFASGFLGASLVTTCLATVLDGWGYGQWTATAWNYFQVNVIEGKAKLWGVEPVWYYFRSYFLVAPPLSSLLVLGTLLAWFSARRFSLTWVSLAFVLGHSLIDHKELRFLFPIVPIVPILFFMGLQKSGWDKRFSWLLSPPMVAGAAFFNGLFVLPLTLLPARTEIAALQTVYLANPQQLYVSGLSPYRVPGVESGFYKPQGMVVQPWNPETALSGTFVVACEAPAFCQPIESEYRCTLLGGSLPEWVEQNLSAVLRARTRLRDWNVLRCAH